MYTILTIIVWAIIFLCLFLFTVTQNMNLQQKDYKRLTIACLLFIIPTALIPNLIMYGLCILCLIYLAKEMEKDNNDKSIY